jgi:hypothetical protein
VLIKLLIGQDQQDIISLLVGALSGHLLSAVVIHLIYYLRHLDLAFPELALVYSILIGTQGPPDTFDFGVKDVTIEGKAVRVVLAFWQLCPEPINGHLLVSVILEQNLADRPESPRVIVLQTLLLSLFNLLTTLEMERILVIFDPICIIHIDGDMKVNL